MRRVNRDRRREDAFVRALCPVALRAGLLRAAWRTALCAWRWRKARSFLPHSSFVLSKRKLQKLCVGHWGPVSLWMCVLSSALIRNALAWRCSRRRDKGRTLLFPTYYTNLPVAAAAAAVGSGSSGSRSSRVRVRVNPAYPTISDLLHETDNNATGRWTHVLPQQFRW